MTACRVASGGGARTWLSALCTALLDDARARLGNATQANEAASRLSVRRDAISGRPRTRDQLPHCLQWVMEQAGAVRGPRQLGRFSRSKCRAGVAGARARLRYDRADPWPKADAPREVACPLQGGVDRPTSHKCRAIQFARIGFTGLDDPTESGLKSALRTRDINIQSRIHTALKTPMPVLGSQLRQQTPRFTCPKSSSDES